MSGIRIVRMIAGLVLAAALHGCGGDTVVKVDQSTQITKGWELKDLQKALDREAITKDEFEKIKLKILKRPN